MLKLDEVKIGVIGLGYVGLPLAVAFGHKFSTVGFDIDQTRIFELNSGADRTKEVDPAELKASSLLNYTSELEELKSCNVFIVAVPTPVDISKRPDLSLLLASCGTIAKVIRPGAVVVFESTVYPGATEDDCVPVIETTSGLKYNKDFYVGYSPERVNPGDKNHRLANIIKVTSGSTPEAADFVDSLYRKIISAGTFRASSIRVAEAAKVIENTQRDVNIALVNELALIFKRLDIDTSDVLEAAATKWNFLPFKPGLVGGHCIGVDPYYLTHKAESVGYHPQVILAGRRINDGMGRYVAAQVIKEMIKKRIHVEGSRNLILGLSFKENCPDLRNSRVIDIIEELSAFDASVDVYDPLIDREDAFKEYGVSMTDEPQMASYDSIIVAVAHDHFKHMGLNKIKSFAKRRHVIFDLKAIYPRHKSVIRI